MFKNISIVTRLIALVSLTAVMLLGTVTYITTNSSAKINELGARSKVTAENMEAFGRIIYLMARNRLILLRSGVQENAQIAAEHIAEYHKNRDEITAVGKRYEETIQDDKQRQLYETWKAHRVTYVKEGLELMAANLKEGKYAETRRVEHDVVRVLNEPIKGDIAAINQYNLELMDRYDQEAKATSKQVQYVGYGLVFFLMLVGGGLAWTIINGISTSLNTLTGTMRKLASGDASARARMQNKDELGLLGGEFDKMVDEREAVQAQIKKENDTLNESVLSLLQAVAQLSRKDLTIKVPVSEDVTGAVADALNMLTTETAKVLSEVTNISADVTQASMRVQAQSSSMLTTAEHEREVVSRTAVSLEDAAQSMRQIADLAQACNLSADRAIATTRQALETVNNTVAGINSTRDVIRETEKRIKRLGERSQEISGVVNLINVIAERTHILALNASMHAASAGEAGRGFAVVADEVQRLAENSRQATQQISTLVSNIQMETADTVATMNNAISQIVEGSRLAEQAGQQMQVTQQTTAELVDSVRQIASTSENQAKAGQSLLENADLIQKSTQQTSAELQDQAAQTSNLLEYAKQLLGAVRVFKLPA